MNPRESALYVPEIGGDKPKSPLEGVAKVVTGQQLTKEEKPQEDDPMEEDPMEEVGATTLAKLSRKKDHVLYMGVITEA